MVWRAGILPQCIPSGNIAWVGSLRHARRISTLRCVELFYPRENGPTYEDQEVRLNGIVRSVRKQKRFAFAHIGDGSTAKAFQAILTPDQAASLSTGTAVEISGIWKKSPAKEQSHELQATGVKVTGDADPKTYPIQKKYHTAEFLRSIPHLRLRTPSNSLLSRFRSETIFAVTDFFRTRKEYGPFYQVQPPLITSSDCEGAGEVFTLAPKDLVEKDEQFFKGSKYLTVSSQLHLEAYAAELGSVWTLSPTFRAERSDTTRHLAEFYMLEAEVSHVRKMEDVMILVEDMIRHIVTFLQQSITGQEMLAAGRQKLAQNEGEGEMDEADGLEKRWDALTQSPAWQRVTYTEAVKFLEDATPTANFEYTPSWSAGLQLEHERYLVEHLANGRPLFVTHYPKTIKPFYMLPSGIEDNSTDPHDDDNETVANFDLLLPHVAELVGGSMREHRLPELIANMRHHGLLRENRLEADGDDAAAAEKYPGLQPNESLGTLEWYTDLRRYGSTPHGGFGLGFDRLLAYLTGIKNVRDVVGFPRYWGKADC